MDKAGPESPLLELVLTKQRRNNSVCGNSIINDLRRFLEKFVPLP